jgi:hypothetical protein
MPARPVPSCSNATFFLASSQSSDITRMGCMEANDVSASRDFQLTWTYSPVKRGEPYRR